jgi:hypothetical protein
MRRVRVPRSVLDGIVEATSQILAGDPESIPAKNERERDRRWKRVEQAEAWAHRVRAEQDAEDRAKRRRTR